MHKAHLKRPLFRQLTYSWRVVEYDISSIANNQETVYIRWGYKIIRGDAFPYSGWTIDDIEFWGNPR
ncbi:MAG: hypothetical protein ACYS6W_15050 [Planctomycetota bacterium]|jgi:hypothetical protein